jgi:tRNA(fMet)-specific endonuclease VapC
MSRVLIDSCAYTRFVAGDRAVLEALSCAGTVFVSVFVLGELKAGFKAGSHEALNKRILGEFLDKSAVEILPAGEDTADFYARIWSSLRKAGRPIPTNDVWIAAQAMETGSVLITYDAHFAQIPGLRIWEQ